MGRLHQKHLRRSGFTLIEMSIVLVVIGLIVGGILTGRDLIRAAAVRATISQIEKYNTAVNTFRGKYGYLPGDINDPDASKFGFAARGEYAGEGDGNGVIEGMDGDWSGANDGTSVDSGETGTFWVDLTKTHLIDSSFSTATPTATIGTGITATTTPNIADYLPEAKIGQNNYVYVYSQNGINYFGFSTINGMGQYAPGTWAGLTVPEAYNMDTKVDDGLPQTGYIIAQFVNWPGIQWAAGGSSGVGASGTVATAGSTSTCYDNGNVAGATQHYSLEQNSKGNNCALSFRFQ